MTLTIAGLNKNRISVDDWLLTEAVRHREERVGRCRDDEPALALARGGERELSERLVIRARALPGSGAIAEDIQRLRSWMRRGAALLTVLGLLAGWLAARASTSDRHVDLLLASVALLGLPSLMLLLWLGLLIWSRRRAGSPSLVGQLLVSGLSRLAPRLLAGPQAAETARAGLDLLRGQFGRWYLSCLSHLFWLAYAAAAIVTLLVQFSIAQYDLSWGTTLLRDETVSRMIHYLAAAPAQLGLIAPPDAAWIASGREGGLVGSQRAEWARLLLAMVILYGAGPRLLFGLLSVSLAWRAARTLNLDRRQPGYLRLVPLLQPDISTSQTLGDAPGTRADKPLRQARNRRGPVVLVGIELERSEQDWPPTLPGMDVVVLGRADRRDQRRALVEALANQRDKPAVLIALCSLLRTPDAGIEQLLDQLANAADSALVLVLDDGDELRRRGGNRASRMADWEALARRAGAHCLSMDLSSSSPDQQHIEALAQLIERAREPA